MSSFFYNPSQHSAMPTMPSVPTHNQHGSRSRRGQRFGSSNNHHQQHHHTRSFKPSQKTREAAEIAHATAFRKEFEAAKSFDLEDDEIFCPWHLLTDDDLHSIHSSSSDRSSSSGGSPDHSPLQHQIQPAQPFTMSAQAQPHMPSVHHGNASHLKIHQPMAQRQRNAIPIVDPNSRNTSPPTSISPNRQAQKQQHYSQRRW